MCTIQISILFESICVFIIEAPQRGIDIRIARLSANENWVESFSRWVWISVGSIYKNITDSTVCKFNRDNILNVVPFFLPRAAPPKLSRLAHNALDVDILSNRIYVLEGWKASRRLIHLTASTNAPTTFSQLGIRMSFTLPKGWEPITSQRVFDAAWQAFIVEKRPPAREEGSCRYLTSDGSKCAIGLCLPDGHPSQQSCTDVTDLMRHYPELFDDVRYFDPSLQCQLHDGLLVLCKDGRCKFREDLEEVYRRCAFRNNLRIPESAPAAIWGGGTTPQCFPYGQKFISSFGSAWGRTHNREMRSKYP